MEKSGLRWKQRRLLSLKMLLDAILQSLSGLLQDLRLQDRIKQHVPQRLRQQLTRPRRSQPHRSCKRTDTKPDCDSAIGQHLLDNDRCALNYDDKRFSILAAARNSFHLNLSEATYIKTRRPVLCRQKEFVYTLKLFR